MRLHLLTFILSTVGSLCSFLETRAGGFGEGEEGVDVTQGASSTRSVVGAVVCQHWGNMSVKNNKVRDGGKECEIEPKKVREITGVRNKLNTE